MKTLSKDLRRIPYLRVAIIASMALIAAFVCNIPNPPTPTPTPAGGGIPAGWTCYTNTAYGFQFCYPSDASYAPASPEHGRISLPVTAGTNLSEKWMDVDAGSGWAVCESPRAGGIPDPASAHPSHQSIGGLDFLVQWAGEGAAGNFYRWTGYSTQRGSVCASLTGVVHTTNPLNYPTPPPTVDPIAESTIFAQIVATFHWLEATPTPAATSAIPAGWLCYTNTTYAFQVCYPSDATLSGETPDHVRIHLAIAAGTNLLEKWMDADGSSGAPACQSPQAAGHADPADLHPSHQTIAGLDFLLQSASEGAAGNIYQWTGYSTQRADVCASLTGVLHSAQPGNYSTPPPLFDEAAESAVFGQIASTFRWLDTTPTPAGTATIPPGWLCYTNATYAFQVCYPSDATLTGETPAHVRIQLTIAPETNLHEKWMDVDGSSGAPVCQSPQAAGYDPSAVVTSHHAFAGLDFLVQSGSEGAAGSIYQWTGYSTQRADVCASLTGVLHSVQPGNYSTPPPLFDQAAESAVFGQIVGTFRWLAATPATSTATSTPTITNTPTQTAISLQFLNLWISTDRFYYRGTSCGPMQVQFQIGVSRPELVKSVGIFFQWKDKSSGNLSGWSEGYNMSPVGGGKYFFTLLSSALVNTRTVEFKEAWLQYQFVANDNGGKPLLWSDVYQNITLAFCGDAPPTTK